MNRSTVNIRAMGLAHRNALLVAAGYAPEFGAAPLDATIMAPIRYALERHLAHHEPYPAVVVNPAYDILMLNEGYRRAVTLTAGPDALERYPNVYRLVFASDGLRPHILCWPAMRAALLSRLRGEAQLFGDSAAARLLAELQTSDPDGDADDERPPGQPVMTLQLRLGDRVLSLFSTITSFGTPLDMTVQELRLEMFFPADEATQRALDMAATGENG